MADQTFRENLERFRRRYAAMRTKLARGRVLDGLCGAFGFERKYLGKLLRGKRGYRPRRGRGRSFGAGAERLLLALREESGWLCAPYLKAAVRKLLAMSAATMGRVLRRNPRPFPGARGGCRPRARNGVLSAIAACPGKALEDGRPGVLQLDSAALGGGLPEPCFYAEHLTDAETQWDELSVAWCRGAEATRDAFDEMAARLPFPVRKLHPDNGSEFMNSVLAGHIAAAHPGVELFRSRPMHKNDNCRIEQKNSSVVRPWFRETRFDDRSQEAALRDVCRRLALYTNLFAPSKKLVARAPRPGKAPGVTYRYDAPKTPLQRLAAADPGNPGLPALWKAYGETNSILLLAGIRRDIARIARACAKSRNAALGIRRAALPAKEVSVSTHLSNRAVMAKK